MRIMSKIHKWEREHLMLMLRESPEPSSYQGSKSSQEISEHINTIRGRYVEKTGSFPSVVECGFNKSFSLIFLRRN